MDIGLQKSLISEQQPISNSELFSKEKIAYIILKSWWNT